jgi:hypothetical protein
MKKLIIILSIFFFSCGTDSANEAEIELNSMNNISLVPIEGANDELSKSKEELISTNNSFEKEQKLIKEGNIRFQTLNLENTKKIILENTKKVKGYISNEEQNKLHDRIELSLDIRIPSNHFDEVLNKISSSAENIDSRNVNIRDVTEDYMDSEIRSKNKKEVENKYRELLKKATKIEEILSIEEKLGEIRSEIETYDGHLKFLDNKIAYSTLHVVFYKNIGSTYGFSFQFIDSLRDGWGKFLNTILTILSYWPFLFLVGLLFFIFKKFKNSKKA